VSYFRTDATIAASYFDGKTARRHTVLFSLENQVVRVEGDGVVVATPLATVETTPAVGQAPRIVRLPGGGHVEITDVDAVDQLLMREGIGPSRLTQWEANALWVAASVVVFFGLLTVGYFYGIPALAKTVAEQLPPAVGDRLSREVLTFLDNQFLLPSELPAEERADFTARLAALTVPGRARPRLHLEFRKGGPLGANAMALPSGTIVVTDELIELAEDDREVLAVLAHEAGHVAHRHGMRAFLQQSVLALVVAWFVGDVGTIAAAAPTALLDANYSRALEREADTFAIDTMRANGLHLAHFSLMLQRLEDAEAEANGPWAFNYLSTHPATTERIERIAAAMRDARP
jgi:Zn-dependent protease with chaperone function